MDADVTRWRGLIFCTGPGASANPVPGDTFLGRIVLRLLRNAHGFTTAVSFVQCLRQSRVVSLQTSERMSERCSVKAHWLALAVGGRAPNRFMPECVGTRVGVWRGVTRLDDRGR